jgi:hypothetical protein
MDVRAVQGRSFVDDDGPRDEREEEQDQEDDLGHQAHVGEEARDTS